MWNREQENIWQDVKNTWNAQPKSEKINIQVAQLVNEFKSKVSQYEKNLINSDVATLKTNWEKVKDKNISQFEKDAIKKDLHFLSEFIRKIIRRFKQ